MAAVAGEEVQQQQETMTTTQVGDLPEACLALAIARTSPREASRCAAVSPAFRAAADSDHVWSRFLPDDLYLLVTAPQSSAAAPKNSGSRKKKDAYLALCHADGAVVPVGGGGGCRVWLERDTGARCYALPARSLSLPWDDGELSWKFAPHPRSRFAEVAELVGCTELDIYGWLPAAALMPSTPYTAYLVYGTAEAHCGLSFPDLQETAVAVGGRLPAERHAVCICPNDDDNDDTNEMRSFSGSGGLRCGDGDGGEPVRRPRLREDGWWEMEMGRVACGSGGERVEEKVVASFEVHGWRPKRGLIVEGMEFRPVHD